MMQPTGSQHHSLTHPLAAQRQPNPTNGRARARGGSAQGSPPGSDMLQLQRHAAIAEQHVRCECKKHGIGGRKTLLGDKKSNTHEHRHTDKHTIMLTGTLLQQHCSDRLPAKSMEEGGRGKGREGVMHKPYIAPQKHKSTRNNHRLHTRVVSTGVTGVWQFNGNQWP